MANTNKKTITTRIQNKHDLEVNWKKATGFIPLVGELVIYDKEVDSDGNTKTITVNGSSVSALPEGRTTAYTYERFKIGDGVTAINDLPFCMAHKTQGVFYIEGDSSSTTDDTNKVATWVGKHNDITEYYNGLTVLYKVPTAGSTTTTLNINNLGAKAVVRNATTAISTACPVDGVLLLTYTTDSNGTAYWKTADYDSNTKTTAGSSNKTGTKMFLIGGTSQSSSGVTTYSNTNVYIGTDNCLYSGGKKVATAEELEGKQATITGGATTIVSDNLTASRALISNSSGKVAVSAVTSTELEYLDGVTSNIQTQLGGKQATITGGATTIVSDNLTASRALISNGSGKVAVSDVTSTELGYLANVTSNVQTQLNSKLSTSGGTITGTLTLSKTQDASGTSNNSPALIVGGAADKAHLEFDGNEIMAKTDGTNPATLNLNIDGGAVSIGAGGLTTTGAITSSDVTSSTAKIGHLDTNLYSARAYTNSKSGYFYKIATASFDRSEDNADTALTLLATGYFGKTSKANGILKVEFRWGKENNVFPEAPQIATLKWLTADEDIIPENFILTYKLDSETSTVTLNIYVTFGNQTWNSMNFTKLSEQRWGSSKNMHNWELFYKDGENGVTVIPEDETQVASVLGIIQAETFKGNATSASSVAWSGVTDKPNATTSAAGLMSAADKEKLNGIATGATAITVDSALSSTSENPVQNKVINSALSGKANSSHTHVVANITDLTEATSAEIAALFAE